MADIFNEVVATAKEVFRNTPPEPSVVDGMTTFNTLIDACDRVVALLGFDGRANFIEELIQENRQLPDDIHEWVEGKLSFADGLNILLGQCVRLELLKDEDLLEEEDRRSDAADILHASRTDLR